MEKNSSARYDFLVFLNLFDLQLTFLLRIDKYLWAIRFYKSRNEASVACKNGRVRIDTVTVKPSREVFGAEKILVRKNQMEFTLLVLGIPKSRVGAKLVERYAKDLTPESLRKARTEIAINQANNRFETGGRPSKKNRRDLMDFMGSESDSTDE
ncbi:MAG: S4 domain-containing protein [Flavobacteriaceae bacterium]|nr:S4 domain-containing protein [Flavobacteriaceae bacterium]